jgi:NADP-dependent 3-hydroxy acid dehydrogenase YdfG
MKLKGKVVLITGANGGIGSALVVELLKRGVAKIYAADLRPIETPCDNVIPVRLDITNPDDIEACRVLCCDIDVLINNAGVEIPSAINSAQSVKAAKLEMNVNCLGLHALSVAFWDTLATKESLIINMLSIASFVDIPGIPTYCASKTAAYRMTKAFERQSLGTSIKVVGIYPGYVDTAMTKDVEIEKITPHELVVNICNDLENDVVNIFPDSMSKKLAQEHWRD